MLSIILFILLCFFLCFTSFTNQISEFFVISDFSQKGPHGQIYRSYMVKQPELIKDYSLQSEKGNWSDWSSCHAECGVGKQTRKCLDKSCEGSNTQICVKPYSKWSEWSSCSKPCGDGQQFRTCLEGDCVGESIKQCNLGDCSTNTRKNPELTVLWIEDRYNTIFFADKLGLDVNQIEILEGDGYTLDKTSNIETINFPNETRIYYVNIGTTINDGETMIVELYVKKFEHNTEFDTYLRSFLEEYEKFTKNPPVPINTINIAFDPNNTLLEGINGETYKGNDNEVYIVINRKRWNNLNSISAKELLIYHELGHGILERDVPTFHTSKLLKDKLNRDIPASIMGQPKVPIHVYENNRESYLHELFMSKSNDNLNLTILENEISKYDNKDIKFSISDVYLVNNNIKLGIYKDNVTDKELLLTIKGTVEGIDKGIFNNKLNVPSDINGLHSATETELLKDMSEVLPKNGKIIVDVTLEYNNITLDQKRFEL